MLDQGYGISREDVTTVLRRCYDIPPFFTTEFEPLARLTLRLTDAWCDGGGPFLAGSFLNGGPP